MAKLNKWEEILNTQANALKGKVNKRPKKNDFDPFDIFPDWFTTPLQNKAENDKNVNQEKDGEDPYSLNNYLFRKRARKSVTPTTYNDKKVEKQITKFSSPDAEQEIAAPTNMGEYGELDGSSWQFDEPVISTKPTETSRKLGLARPGPSSFIQTAKYNPTTKQLNIAYTDGTIFPYQNVSPELADKILKKKNYHSPGQTLLNTIFYGHGTTKADQIGSIDEGM